MPVWIDADTSCRDDASTAEMEKSMSLETKRPSTSVSAMFEGFTANRDARVRFCNRTDWGGRENERAVVHHHDG